MSNDLLHTPPITAAKASTADAAEASRAAMVTDFQIIGVAPLVRRLLESSTGLGYFIDCHPLDDVEAPQFVAGISQMGKLAPLPAVLASLPSSGPWFASRPIRFSRFYPMKGGCPCTTIQKIANSSPSATRN